MNKIDNTKVMNNFCQRLNILMIKNNLTPNKLAKNLNAGADTIRRYINHYIFNLQSLIKICDLLQINISDIITDESSEKEDTKRNIGHLLRLKYGKKSNYGILSLNGMIQQLCKEADISHTPIRKYLFEDCNNYSFKTIKKICFYFDRNIKNFFNDLTTKEKLIFLETRIEGIQYIYNRVTEKKQKYAEYECKKNIIIATNNYKNYDITICLNNGVNNIYTLDCENDNYNPWDEIITTLFNQYTGY